MQRICEDLNKPLRSIERMANENFETLQSNGSWKDVDYTDVSITKWNPKEHLIKQQSLIQAYITKNSIFYANDKVYDAIINTFKYWVEKNPQSSNWWHNEIDVPQTIGESLILMRFGKKKLPANLEQSLITMMERGNPYEKTGANKTDIALHFFYRALLTQDKGLMESAIEQLFEPIQFVHYNEGLQYDYSYLQHVAQLQISSYGAVFITGILKLAKYVKGTPYELDATKLQMFSNYYRNSYLKAIRGQYIDFNTEGRGISRKDILNKKEEKNRLSIAKLIDPEHANEWDMAIARTDGVESPGYGIKASHTHFWNADYTMHLRPSYSFNVRMVSNRTKRNEAGNQENLLGKYLSDGATNIQVRGPEYYNIMPVWEWDKIPGVTSRDYAQDQEMTVFWGEDGSSDFSGGVSDKTYGASAYHLNYDGVSAKKAWFFFDKEIVCLGTDIKSETPENITTTVNQSWLNGNVLSSMGKIDKDEEAVTIFKDDKKAWILHDDIGYYFPKGENVNISTINQKGNWYQINNSFSKDEVSGNVFKLWFDHGMKPSNASYSYIVLPSVVNKDLENFKASTISIIANSDRTQAVYHSQLDIVQVVFYQAGKIDLPTFSIKTDKPCILMIKNLNNPKVDISVADPSQKEKAITIELKNLKTGKKGTLDLNFPQNEFAGSTLTSSFEF